MSRGTRFRAPDQSPPPGAAWVLRRAFGARAPAQADAPPEALLELAVRLGLSARIGARTSRAELEREVGPTAARAFARHAAACAAQSARLDQVVAEMAAAAARVGAPVALLKYAALARRGCLAPGSRWACDIDVLAPEPLLRLLAAALEESGWDSTGAAYEHQLPALTHPLGGSLELHRVMLGVRLANRRASARFDDLRRQGLLDRSPETGADLWLPQPHVLAAHAVAHGLGQHGFEPGSYPHFRLVGDLQDLRLVDDPISVARIEAWLARSVPTSEVRGLFELVSRLSNGDEVPADRPAGALLAHFFAGALDPSYRESLKLGRLRTPFSDAPRPLAVARAVRRAVFPSRAELTAIYGAARSRRQTWRQRLARPFDVLRKFVDSVRARRRQAPRPGSDWPPSLWSPVEWVRILGSVGPVTYASLRIAWLLRSRTVLQAAPLLREGRALPMFLRSPRRLEAVAGRLLWALPPRGLGPCLKRSLVLLEVWSRCGVDARLHLGLRREAAGAWEGHAWLSAEGDAPVEAGYSEMAVV